MTNQKSISLNSNICRNENSLAAEIDGEVMLMSIDNGKYYGLNDIAADIWQRLETPISVAKLCAEMLKEYEADAATIERDVLALLEKLAQEKLIKAIP